MSDTQPLELAASDVLQTLPVSELHAAPWNARKYFDPVALRDLAHDIRHNGQAQPIVVRPRPAGGYEVVAGERRWRAAQANGISELEAVVREMDDLTARRQMMAENLNREDLNPYEETTGVLDFLAVELSSARKWDELVEEHGGEREAVSWVVRRCGKTYPRVHPNALMALGMGEDELEQTLARVFGERVGMTVKSFVRNRLPLLHLPESIRDALEAGAIEYTKANVIAGVSDAEARDELLRRAIDEALPFAVIVDLAAAAKNGREVEDEDRAEAKQQFQRVTRYFRYYGGLDGNQRKKVDRLLRELAETLEKGVSEK